MRVKRFLRGRAGRSGEIELVNAVCAMRGRGEGEGASDKAPGGLDGEAAVRCDGVSNNHRDDSS